MYIKLIYSMEDKKREECNIDLGLAIGNNVNYSIDISHDDHKKQTPVQFHILFPPRLRDEELEEDEEQQQQQQEKKGSRDILDRDQEEDSLVKDNCGSRKLRLSQDQASLLEDTFRMHNTLNSYQKQQLAEKLKLRPRQVEVWFQNRRVRNKMKRTKMDFQLLKRWCETLNDENRRLKQELHELKVVKPSLCSTCEHTLVTTSKKSYSGDSIIDY